MESILRPKGNVVLKAYTGRQALELVRKVSPDVVLIDFHLPDMDGIDVARELRQAEHLDAVTPVLMMTSSTVGRAERLEALEAGAWDILRHPVDPSELILRMETFVRAKHQADQIREEGLTDPATGLYNLRGLLRRATEVSADAVRHSRPLACVAFGPEWTSGPPEEPTEDAAPPAPAEPEASTAWAFKSVTRLSDMVGRLSTGEFVIVAPGTGREGALRLADRVLALVEQAARGEQGAGVRMPEGYRLRAGFYASGGAEAVSPEDLLFRATMALRRAQSDVGGFRVRSYEA
jgi:PleD family two-component response regulator